MAIEDHDRPRKKVTHEIGQDLSLLSVEELTERIALMNSEIDGRDGQEARVQGCGEQFFQDVEISISGTTSWKSIASANGAVRCDRFPPLGQWPTWQTKA
jgi:uncharacterized small protein (DUF1192 family)